MPNTVLGKVSVVPKGDYSASTTYYALDIVGYNGGSYLAMQEVTGVTPSNDQTNWMQLSGPGLPGEQGPQGVPGAAAGFGEATATVDDTSGTPSVEVETSGPDTAKVFTFKFYGLKGTKGDTGDKGDTGETGPVGPQGVSVVTAQINEQGHLIITLSEGEPIDAGDATGPIGPQGIQGEAGESVGSIQRTSGTGAPGTTDTYTMYDSNDDAIGTFTVYNGANGAGAGDMMADGSVPMTGPLNMGGNKITNLGAPGADTDAVRKSDLDAVAAEVDGILDGTTPAHLAPATDTKIGGVIIGDGLSVEADGTVSADDQFPTGGTQGQVLTQGTTGPEWQDAPSGLPDGGAPGQVLTKGESGPEWTDAPDPLPTGGETGQVLTKTASGTAWDDVPSDLPSGGTDGQVLTKTTDGVAWEDAASGLPDGGTSGQMLYQGANGPEWGDRPVLYVNITTTPSETSADKSYAQIVAAKEAGYAVFALYTTAIIPLVSIQSNQVVFSVRTYSNERVASLQIAISKNNIVAVSMGLETTNAKDVEFSPASSGLSSTNVQDAIEEVQSNIPTAPSDIGALEAPEGGTTGQILEKTATGTQWADKPSGGISQSEADARYLQLSGGVVNGSFFAELNGGSIALSEGGNVTFTSANGSIGMRNNRISSVANPVNNNDAANKSYVDSLKPTRLTVTLNSSSWSGNSQTITVNGVITNTSAQDIDISCADKASADAWAAGGVWCSNPTQANRLTFTCTTPPKANINLNIRLWEVG